LPALVRLGRDDPQHLNFARNPANAYLSYPPNA
jgi:hypothetical protein